VCVVHAGDVCVCAQPGEEDVLARAGEGRGLDKGSRDLHMCV